MVHFPGLLMSLNNNLKETQYDEAGRVVSRTMGNDVSQIYDFNDWETAGGRLDTFTTGPIIDPLLNIAYGYDEVGNRNGLTISSENLTEKMEIPEYSFFLSCNQHNFFTSSAAYAGQLALSVRCRVLPEPCESGLAHQLFVGGPDV